MAGIGIGALARHGGVSVDTVRFYEREGVLPVPARRPSGYRVYDDSAVTRLLLARQLRAVGLTVREVAAALGAHLGPDACAAEVWRLELARDRIDARIQELTEVRRGLSSMIADCTSGQCVMVRIDSSLRQNR